MHRWLLRLLLFWRGPGLLLDFSVRDAELCLASAQGCFNTTLTGPGTVWIQSMPYEKMKGSLGTTVTKKKPGEGGGAPPQMLRE